MQIVSIGDYLHCSSGDSLHEIQILYSRKNKKKNIINLSSSELAQTVLNQGFPWLIFWQFLLPKPCSEPLKVRGKGPE